MEAGGEVVLFLKMLHQLKINKTDERILKLSQLCILHHPNPCETTAGISRDSYSETVKPNTQHTEKLHNVKVKNCAI